MGRTQRGMLFTLRSPVSRHKPMIRDFSHPSLLELWLWLQHPAHSCFSAQKLISRAYVNYSVFCSCLKQHVSELCVSMIIAHKLSVRDDLPCQIHIKQNVHRASALVDKTCCDMGEVSCCLALCIFLLLNHTLNFIHGLWYSTNWQFLAHGAAWNHSGYSTNTEEPAGSSN